MPKDLHRDPGVNVERGEQGAAGLSGAVYGDAPDLRLADAAVPAGLEPLAAQAGPGGELVQLFLGVGSQVRQRET
jgi:hypothetical protein